MFKFLLGIILFFLLLILLAGSLGIRFLRSLFGQAKNPPQQNPDAPRNSPKPDNDKIFGDQEGEYIEFEEVKEPTQSSEPKAE